MKTYTFHVSQPGGGRVWRKIELSGDQTLEELHYAIQDAYGWDADHLYSFFMSGRAWDSSTEYSLPEGADPWSLDLDGEDEDSEDGREGGGDEQEVDGKDADPSEEAVQQLTALGITPDSLQEALEVLEDKKLTVDEKWMRVGPLANQLFDYLADLENADLAGNVRETTLDQLELEPGKKFLYIFDYGDEHHFQIRVHDVNPDAPDGDYPRLVESVGEAPEQYPSWDEDVEEEDVVF